MNKNNQISYSLLRKDMDIRNLFRSVLPDRQYTEEIPDAATAAQKVIENMRSDVFYHYAGENPLWRNPITRSIWKGNGDMEDFVVYDIPLEFEKMEMKELEELIAIWVANFGGKVGHVIGRMYED